MASQGYPPASDLVEGLRTAIRRCELQWSREPAYHEIAHLLDEALSKLDQLSISPGDRAAKDAAAESRQDSEKSEY